MKRDPYEVRVKSNGAYWQAWWYDAGGKIRVKSLGSRAKYSLRQARVLARRHEDELRRKPGVHKGYALPTLGRWLATYLRDRTDLSESTRLLHRGAARYLLAHFGWRRPLDKITAADAAAFRSRLSRGELAHARRGKKYVAWQPEKPSAPTVAKIVRIAKVVFGEAVKRYGHDFDLSNPFAGQSGKAPAAGKDWHHVDVAELRALLQAARNDGWRLFLLLMRVQGFRRGEALSLMPRHVHRLGEHTTIGFGARNIDIYGVLEMPGQTVARKTGETRTIPILRPEVAELLAQLCADAPRDQPIITPAMVSRTELRKPLQTLIRKAGLKPWADLFHVLRRNAETDIANLGLPQYVVSSWVGHTIKVSMDYYLPNPLAQSLAQQDCNVILTTQRLWVKDDKSEA